MCENISPHVEMFDPNRILLTLAPVNTYTLSLYFITILIYFFKAYESSFSVGRQIQSQINKVVLEIPRLIELTKKKVMESRQTFNYRKVAGATGIALGKLIQVSETVEN